MPGGVLTGDGSQGNPYIVMDGYDLNALRTKIVTSGVFPYVELGADIDMSVYANFVPLPMSYCNFDGKNHRIYNLNISDSSTLSYTGLFSTLHSGIVKDLCIDGSVINAYTGGSTKVGMLAGYLYIGVAGGKVSGVHCSGYVQGRSYNSACIGGICGVFTTDNIGGNNAIENSSFYGAIAMKGGGGVTDQASMLPVISGIVGDLSAYNTASVTVSKCIAQFTAVLEVSSTTVGIVGIAGKLNPTTNGSVTVERCVAIMEVQIPVSSAVTSSYPLNIGGISANNTTTSGASINRCAAHVVLKYDPPFTIDTLKFSGIFAKVYSSGTTMPISMCYAVISIQNPNSKPFPTTFQVDGICVPLPASSTASFYDADVLTASFSGPVVSTANGRATAQLKSQAYLESQGWVF